MLPIRRPKGQGNVGWEKQADSAPAGLRTPAERAFAEPGRWGQVLDLLRISPNRTTGALHALLMIT
ncbi:hypothetical protein ABT189_01470 [Streptomyces sp900105755]|uniref:hypothetical protein n=1 Tax=Streptomyces sp. 900105755 TaxID=3154389 RepID=UPI00331E6BB8